MKNAQLLNSYWRSLKQTRARNPILPIQTDVRALLKKI